MLPEALARDLRLAARVLLDPLPGVPEPARLVALETTDPDEGFVNGSYPEYLDLRERVRSLEGVIAFDDQVVAAGPEAARVDPVAALRAE